MSLMMIFYALLITNSILFLFLFYFVFQKRKIHQELTISKRLISNAEKKYQNINYQLDELRNAMLDLGLQFKGFETQFQPQLSVTNDHRKTDVSKKSSNANGYEKASSMLSAGAKVSEVMLTCELSRAEVELMINLNKSTQ